MRRCSVTKYKEAIKRELCGPLEMGLGEGVGDTAGVLLQN